MCETGHLVIAYHYISEVTWLLPITISVSFGLLASYQSCGSGMLNVTFLYGGFRAGRLINETKVVFLTPHSLNVEK